VRCTLQSYEYLRPYAKSPEDLKKLDALLQCGSVIGAAGKYGISDRVFRRSIARLKADAALSGVSPDHDMTHAAPDGYLVKGTSTLYGDDGQVKQQWVKTQVDVTRRIELI